MPIMCQKCSTKSASFGTEADGRPVFCKTCIPSEEAASYSNFRAKWIGLCEICKTKQANFSKGPRDEHGKGPKPTRCRTCCLDDPAWYCSKRQHCKTEGCPKQAMVALPTAPKGSKKEWCMRCAKTEHWRARGVGPCASCPGKVARWNFASVDPELRGSTSICKQCATKQNAEIHKRNAPQIARIRRENKKKYLEEAREVYIKRVKRRGRIHKTETARKKSKQFLQNLMAGKPVTEAGAEAAAQSAVALASGGNWLPIRDADVLKELTDRETKKLKAKYDVLAAEKIKALDAMNPPMVDVFSRKCTVCKERPAQEDLCRSECLQLCKTLPLVSLQNRCLACRKEKVVSVTTAPARYAYKRCVKCQARVASFAMAVNEKATHCRECKEVGMVSTELTGCVTCHAKGPLYNDEKVRKGMYCRNCKTPSMVAKTKDRWAYKNCKKCLKVTASYNYPHENKAVRCKKCAEEGMVNVRHRLCAECGQRKAIAAKRSSPNDRAYCLQCLAHTDDRSAGIYRKQKRVQDRKRRGDPVPERAAKRRRKSAKKEVARSTPPAMGSDLPPTTSAVL